jgi:TIR domain
MARKQLTQKPAESPPNREVIATSPLAIRTSKPLVFISHDSRDADLASAFGELLTDVSTGTIKYFQSSDNRGGAGIEYGDDWYAAIIAKLREATDVVALLTPRSLDRPWILYEAGIAVGKLDTRVIGLTLGVPFSSAITGPFGLFQKPTDDEDSLTKLMMQLLQRNPDAAPREEAVRIHVRLFRDKTEGILAARGADTKAAENTPEQSIAKLFEEVKEMVRELPERVGDSVGSSVRVRSRKSRRFHPRMLDELLFHPKFRGKKGEAEVGWLVLISLLREDYPWLYEPGMEFYRALRSGEPSEIRKAEHQLTSIVELMRKSPIFLDLLRPEDEEVFYMLGHLDEFIHRARIRIPREGATGSSVGSSDTSTGE